MKIETLDPVWTQCDEEAADYIRNELSYKVERWERRFGKNKRIVEKEYLVQGWEPGQYMFLTGFIDRALDLFDYNNQEVDYTCNIETIPYQKPAIDDVVFRDYQYDLIMKALKHGYGTIVSPTGSGKSYIIYGILSAFPESNILILVHTLDLVNQLHTDLTEKGYEPGMFTGKKKELKRITIASVQAYAKVSSSMCEHWGVVMVDEGHHVSSAHSGMYYNALAYCGASARFAFTATESDKEEQRVGLEGLIGPVIGELTMEEGQAIGFLAEPEIIFRACPLPDAVFMYRVQPGYNTIYKDGIVDNFNRNIQIITEAEKEVKKGGIVLILVKQVRHMNNIVEHMDIPVDVVKGEIDAEERLKIKEDLKTGKKQCVIATTAWVEGVDIPNLTMGINAGGGISEKETRQKIGRVLRKTETKDTVKYIDFMDVRHTDVDPFGRQKAGYGSKHMLHKQSLKRWKTYEDSGWEPKLK